MSEIQSVSELLIRRNGSVDDLRKEAAVGRLYAILDACDTPAVPEKAQELGEERAVSLYRGSAEEMYWAVAPYLFVVDEAVLEWVRETLWNEPFGIFAVADMGLEAMRRHFRHFLLVDAPYGERWYFRFYDPRVISRFLSTCSADQISQILGPISRIGTAAPVGERIVWFSSGHTRITIRRRSPTEQ